MRVVDLAKALAARVRAVAADKGSSEVIDLDTLAAELGESDPRNVSDAGLLLQSRGLIRFLADNANLVCTRPEALVGEIQLEQASGIGQPNPKTDLGTQLASLRDEAGQLQFPDWAAVDRVRGMVKMIIHNVWGPQSHYLADWERISFRFGVGVDVEKGFVHYKDMLLNLIETMEQELRLFPSAQRAGEILAEVNRETIENYVDTSRIDALRSIKSRKLDLTRLVEMCEELNECWRSGCLVAVALLVRAIMDHVPPVFGFGTFAEVANNYKGSKSFKELMVELHAQSRKVADQYLHVPIRPKEILPTQVGVDSRKPLDALLGEVIRILMAAEP